tara:strand:+ start:2901 stop:3269 length:369 start_codon:yes stop_codon:yes gene_type:complete
METLKDVRIALNQKEEDKKIDQNRLRANIHKFLECTEDQTFEIIDILLADIKLFDQKQRDYGKLNIAKFGQVGVLVRVSDKVERLTNLIQSARVPNNESVEDSWQDLSIYGAIARVINKGSW